MSALSASDKDQYLSEGYVVLRGLLPADELEEINGEINELFILQLKRLNEPANEANTREAFLANATALLKADIPIYINTARVTQMLPSVHRILICQPIIDAVRELGVATPLISTRASIHIMSDDLKIPNGYHKTPPHQDWRSIQGSLDNVVLWAPTTPVAENSYPLEVVPKSHLLGLLPTAEHIMTPMVNDPRIREDMYVRIPVEPGDLILFSSLLVHRTGEEGDGLARIALSGRFNNGSERTFVDRGYPTPYSYSYRKDLMFENFPTESDLKTVFPGARAEI